MPGKEYPLSRAERASLDLKQLQKSCAHCGLSQLCLPASIGGEDLPRLDQVVQVKKSLDGEQTLYAAGQPFRALYVVRSGAFKTFTADGDGETQILGFHLPGEIMGLDAIAAGAHQCSAEGGGRSIARAPARFRTTSSSRSRATCRACTSSSCASSATRYSRTSGTS